MNFNEHISNGNLVGLRQNIEKAKSLLLNILEIPSFSEAKAHDTTEIFWTNPESAIYPWLLKHGIKTPIGILPPFTQGGVGRAYFLKNHVVKFSANKVEANVAKMVAGRTDLPTIIIDVLPLNDGFYAILQNFANMTNISQQIKMGADYLTLVIDNMPEMVINGFPTNSIEQNKIAKIAVEKFGRNRTEIIPFMVMMMVVLNKLYKATGFIHTDAVPQNIGIYKGKFRIPDLGPNETGNFNARKELNKIYSNRKKLGLPPHEEI